MSNPFDQMSNAQARRLLVSAAVRALEEAGLAPERLPGRGLSNMWDIEEKGKQKRAAIRTSKDRWFAFQPLEEGTAWKTLDFVDIVIVAAVDDRVAPQNIQVYRFDAQEVWHRFDAAYQARSKAGRTLRDGFGLWICLDKDERDNSASVGSGLAADCPPFAAFPLADLLPETAAQPPAGFQESEAAAAPPQTRTIAEVMDWARRRIADLSGVSAQAVKLDCRIET